MAVNARTIEEARDHILKRVNAEGVSKWETIVLQLLNDAVVFISNTHDWRFLQKYDTLTMPDATGVVTLPAECDRIMAVHTSGEDELLTELQPQDFESHKEAEVVSKPSYFCVYDSVQASTSVAPCLKIEIYTAPSSGTVFQLWYKRYIDEFDSGTINIVPNMPPRIWDLVVRHARMETLKMNAVEPSEINIEAMQFGALLDQYKKSEKYGAAKHASMKMSGSIATHYARRFK